MDRRDSNAYPEMLPVKMRSKKTITALFFLTVQLMTKDPPIWAFKCGTCQDKVGQFRIVTADGIGLGYLKRLASRRYVVPAEICTSVCDAVHAASIHASEWVRRFLRMTLKQPSKPTVIKAAQLNSAKRALALLCPAALPHFLETLLSGERKLQLLRLRAFLSSLWDLDRAAMSLANGIVAQTKKLLTASNGLSQEQVTAHRLTLQCIYSWLLHIEQGPNGGGVAGGMGVIVGGEAAAAAGAAAGTAAGGVLAGGAGGNVVVGIGGEGQGAQAAAVGAGGAAGAGAAAVRGVRGGGSAANAPAAGGARAPGERAARGPAATAPRHHMDRTTNKLVDPRCLRPNIKALGDTVHRDILSFAIAVTIDPVVNPFKLRHYSALSQIADVLKAADGLSRMQELKRRVALAVKAQPPAGAAGAQPPPLVEAGAQEPPVQVAPEATTEAVVLLKQSRLLNSFLVAISGTPVGFSTLATLAADVLLSFRSTIEDYLQPREGTDGTAAMKWEVDRWMRWFTWMAALCPLGPPGIPQATPLPVPETTLSQCSPRHFHSPPVQGLRRTSPSGACASSVVSRPPPHNPVTTPRTIFPDLTTRRGVLTKRYTNQVQTSTSHTQWNANKYTSLSHQKPACKYSSNGVLQRSSTLPQLHWSSCKSTGTAGIDTSKSTPRDFSCRRYRYRPQQKNRR